MKKKISLVMLLAVAYILPSKSQGQFKDIMYQYDSYKDNWYISFGSGVQIMQGEDDRKGSFMNALTYAPSITIGKRFTPVYGFRMNFTGGSLHGYNDGIAGTYRKWNSGQNNYLGSGVAGTPGYPAESNMDFLTWDPQWNYKGFELGKDILHRDGQYYWIPGLNGELYRQTVHYAAMHINATFDMMSLIKGFNIRRKTELIAFLGPSIFHVFPHQGQIAYTGFGLNGGLNTRVTLSEKLDFFVEANMSLYPDDFDGQAGDDIKTDFVGQLTTGLSVKIGRQSWNPALYVPNEEITQLNEGINNERVRSSLEPKAPRINMAVNYVVPYTDKAVKHITGEAFVVFPQAKSELMPTLENNRTEIAKIYKSIDDVLEQNGDIERIQISGSASPEGAGISNVTLSRRRSIALKDYIKQHYNFDESKFEIEYSGENWDGLLKALPTTLLSNKEKTDIANIINKTPDSEERKKKISSYRDGIPYQYLLREVYPKLRRTDYKIEFTEREFSVEKGKQDINAKAETLSLQEMYHVALSHPKGSVEYRRSFETAAILYAHNPVSKINAAAVALEDERLLEAEEYLKGLENNPQAYNNLGVLYSKLGKTDQAEAFFILARDNGNQEAELNMQKLKSSRDILDQYAKDLERFYQMLDKENAKNKKK